jgi:hypothetical protein
MLSETVAIFQSGNLPRTTEAERLVIQRVGQDVFRDALMAYWGAIQAVRAKAAPAAIQKPRSAHSCRTKRFCRRVWKALRLAVRAGVLG